MHLMKYGYQIMNTALLHVLNQSHVIMIIEDTDIISSLYGHIDCHQESLQCYLEGYYLST